MLLRVRAWAEGRSFWSDEASLGLNFLSGSILDLVSQPLDNNQSAPIGFLIFVKLSTLIFGENVYSFRLPALFAGVATLYFATGIAQRSFQNHLTALFFLASVALSPVLIYYSSELKHYGFDVLVATYAISLLTRPERRTSISVLLFVFFLSLTSIVSIPILLTVGLLSFVDSRKTSIQSEGNRRVGFFSWGGFAAFLSGSAFNLGHTVLTADRDYMVSWWKNAGGFPPPTFQYWDSIRWYFEAIINQLGDPFWDQQISLPNDGPVPLFIWAPAVTLALVGLFRRQCATHAIALAIFALPFALSSAMIYPLSSRLSLFVIPASVFLIAKGLERMTSEVHLTKLVACGTLVSLLLGQATIQNAYRFLTPNDQRDTIWVFSQVKLQGNDADILYYHGYSARAVDFHNGLGFDPGAQLRWLPFSDAPIPSEVSLPDKFWLMAVHALGDVREISDDLERLGYTRVCSFDSENTFLARFANSDISQDLACELEPR